ncbi:MAG: hypothetical protein ACREIA_04320, partial [Opitutaceae bacterium]
RTQHAGRARSPDQFDRQRAYPHSEPLEASITSIAPVRTIHRKIQLDFLGAENLTARLFFSNASDD